MVNTSISGTSVIGLSRCGGSSSQISKEKEVTGIILNNGAPLAYEVNFIKIEGIADNHIN